MNDDAVAVVRRYLEAEFRQDPDGMIAELSGDVILEMPHAPEGVPRRLEGRELVGGLMKDWMTTFWSELRATHMDVRPEADPERVVAEYASQGVIASNGKPYVQQYVGLFTVRGGKIVFHSEFHDPFPIMAGLG